MEYCPYDARAMANPLTDRALPAQLAASGQVIETKGKLSEFPRLRKVVEADLAGRDIAQARLSASLDWGQTRNRRAS